MIKHVNDLQGLDFSYPHHCKATKDNLGYVSAIFNDDDGSEYCQVRIELNGESINAVRAKLASIKNEENKEMLTEWFERGVERQLYIRAEIKILAVKMQLSAAKRGFYYNDAESFEDAKNRYTLNIEHPLLSKPLGIEI